MTNRQVNTEKRNIDTPSQILRLDSLLYELAQIVHTTGLFLTTTVTQVIQVPYHAVFIFSGKVSKLRFTEEARGSRPAILEAEFRLAQRWTLAEALSKGGTIVKVIDQTAAILDISDPHKLICERQR